MTITAEHAAAMQAGAERKRLADAAKQAAAEAAYSAWVKEDARLWAAFINLEGPEFHAGHVKWKAHFRTIPVVP